MKLNLRTKLLSLMCLSAVLAVLTPLIFFCAVPMRIVYKTFGRATFFFCHLGIGLGLSAFQADIGIIFLLIALLVGTYALVEETGSSMFNSGLTALMATIGCGTLALGMWIKSAKINLAEILREDLKNYSERLTSVNADVKVDIDAIIMRVPSGIVIVLILIMAIALIWENRARILMRIPVDATASKLRAFKVPDAFIWITMAATLGAFAHLGNETVELISINVLNVLVLIYFLQGLAIVAEFFRHLQISVFWKGFWYFLIVVQLFLVVGLLGFVDFWMDFRERIAKKSIEIKKEI